MRILLGGSLEWSNPGLIETTLHYCVTNSDGPATLVHAGRKVNPDGEPADHPPQGAEAMAQHIWLDWLKNGIVTGPPEIHRPNIRRHTKGQAIRVANGKMVSLGADICLAFIRNRTADAEHLTAIAQQAGIPVRILRENTTND